MYTVYVIQNEKGKIYIGQTSDLEIRLQRHNQSLPQKKTSFTKRNAGVWKPVYTEEFQTREDAMKRERQLKTSAGRRFIKSKLLESPHTAPIAQR